MLIQFSNHAQIQGIIVCISYVNTCPRQCLTTFFPFLMTKHSYSSPGCDPSKLNLPRNNDEEVQVMKKQGLHQALEVWTSRSLCGPHTHFGAGYGHQTQDPC